MAYREDLEAAAARAVALERELAEARAENQRLRDEAAGAGPERQAGEEPAQEGGEREDRVEELTEEPGASEVAPPSPENRRWLRIGSSALGFTRYGWFYYGLPIMLMPVGVLGGILVGEWATPLILFIACSLAMSVILGGLVKTARTGAEALEWIEGLPFRVGGLVQLFKDGATSYDGITVRVRWAGAPPPLDALQTVVGGAALIDKDRRCLRVSWGPTTSALVANRRIFKTARRLIDGVLVPLHRGHVITAVTFKPGD